jgi:hypothetical protein
MSALAARITVSRSRPPVGIVAGAAAAAAAGAAIGSGRGAGLLLGAAMAGMVLFLLPISWLVYGTALVSLTYRWVAPSGTGPLNYLPDALIVVLFLQVGAKLARGNNNRLPWGMRAMILPLLLFVALAVASTLVNDDTGVAFIASFRQFVRFPLLALAVVMSDIDWAQARTLVWVVLGLSLLQFPLAYQQYGATGGGRSVDGVFYQGDPVSGTFGEGGSGAMMVFLVLSGTVWLSFALERVIPSWTVLFLAPILVLPMAWGSAAGFVIFLPAAIVTLLVRLALSRQAALSIRKIAGGTIVLLLVVWTARTIAVAPGFAGSGAPSALKILSKDYLNRYLSAESSEMPTSRVGFLRFAFDVNLHDGPRALLVGQGPSASIIGESSEAGAKLALSHFTSRASRNVWSLQRLLLGYGFAAVGLLILLIGLPAAGLLRRRAPRGAARSLVLAGPVLGVLYLAAGPYNAAWTDPGVAAAFWAFIAAAYVGVREDDA